MHVYIDIIDSIYNKDTIIFHFWSRARTAQRIIISKYFSYDPERLFPHAMERTHETVQLTPSQTQVTEEGWNAHERYVLNVIDMQVGTLR